MTITFLLYLQSNSGDSDVICPIVVGLVLVLIIIGVYGDARKKANALAASREAYHNSLKRLKASPTNADLRQETLKLGRRYSNLTRNKRGVTIFDEVALSNDINAACAGTTNIHENKSAKPDQTIELRLQRLADLKAKGLIDDEEYAARREKILDEV
jgi:ribosome-binding protein aMBF1 (putative translation factor)